MEIQLTEEQQLLQQTAREFARREVQPRAAEIDDKHRFPADIPRSDEGHDNFDKADKLGDDQLTSGGQSFS